MEDDIVIKRKPGRPRKLPPAEKEELKEVRAVVKQPKKYKKKKKLTNPTQKWVVKDRVYVCYSCGKPYDKLMGNFIVSPHPFYKANNGHVHVCKTCLQHYESEYTELMGGDVYMALKRMAMYFGFYAGDAIINICGNSGTRSKIATLASKQGLRLFMGKTYDTYLDEQAMNILLEKSDRDAGQPDSLPGADCPDETEADWTEADLKNRSYVIHSIGYDCFDDVSYTGLNKKFLYNTFADYLTDEVLEDQHKLQSIISMVKSLLQRENIDRLLNAQMRQPKLNYDVIDRLGKIKAGLTSDINATAKENAISAKNAGRNTKNSNSLTTYMKEMLENGYSEVKVNITDVKLSAAYREIAETNARALMNELGYQQDDYARLLSESRIFAETLQSEIMGLEEENRLLKLENRQLKGGAG